MHVPSESVPIGLLECVPTPHVKDTELLSYEGFTLKANKSLLIWSGPSQREDGSQTVTGHIELRFVGPSDISVNGYRKVVGGLSVIPGGEQISLDAGKIGTWYIELNLILRGPDELSVMTLTRKRMSGRIFGTETYRFSAHCTEVSG